MRAKLIKDCDGPNPDWNPRDPESAHSIALPAGTVIEGDDAWMHVIGGRAIPDDDACWKRVEKRNPLIVEKILKRFPDARRAAEPPKGEASTGGPDPIAKLPRKPKATDAPPAA